MRISISKDQALKLAVLAASPEKVSLLSIMDGFVYDFVDDGIAANRTPNVRRSNIYAQLDKVDAKSGLPIYWAGKRIVDKEGKVSFEAAKIEPKFEGDPLGRIPSLSPEAEKVMRTNMLAREMAFKEAQGAKSEQLAQWLVDAVKRAGVQAGDAAVAAKGAKS